MPGVLVPALTPRPAVVARPTGSPTATARPAPAPAALPATGRGPGSAAPSQPPAAVPPAAPPAGQGGDNSTRTFATQLQPDQVVTGGLEGDAAGRFAWYRFTKGPQPVITVDVEIHPDDPGVLRAAGFRVFGPNPNRDYGRGGVQRGHVPNVSGDVVDGEPGQYFVQVYNFNPGTHIGFALAVGPLGPQPVATGGAWELIRVLLRNRR